MKESEKIVVIDDEVMTSEEKKDIIGIAREIAEKQKSMVAENKMMAKDKLKLTNKEKVFLAKMSKKDRRRFINKSNGVDENHGVSGPTKKTPFGKNYF